MKALFYMRVSSDEQSVDAQRVPLRSYYDGVLKGKGFEFGGEFVDEDISGGKPFLSRPSGLKCSLAADQGDLIVASKLDRAFRNTPDALSVADILKARGVGLVLLDVAGQVIDTTSAFGYMLLTIGAAFATFERMRMGERMREFCRARRLKGRPSNQMAPYGSKNGGPKGDRYYIPDPEQCAMGAKFVHWHDDLNWSWWAIWRHLREQRCYGPRGDVLNIQTIRNWCHKEKALRLAEQERGIVYDPNTPVHGQASQYRKLTQQQADEIRRRHAAGEGIKPLAREYKIDRESCRRIIRGTRYVNPNQQAGNGQPQPPTPEAS